MAYENIEKLGGLLRAEEIGALQKSVSASEKKLSDLLKKLNDLEAAAIRRREEEEARMREAALEAERKERERLAAEAALKEAEEQAKEAQKAQEKAQEKAPETSAPAAPRPAERPVYRPESKPQARPSYNNPAARGPLNGARPTYTPRPTTGPAGARPPMQRPARPVPMPPPAPVAPRRDAGSAKKYDNKAYAERRPVNKRALQRQQGADIGDFDKESGYRKARFQKKGARKETQTIKIEHAVVTSKDIPIKVLSEKLGISAVEIVKRLFREGVTKTVNESVDYDNAAFIALELGIDLEYKPEKTAEDALFEAHGAIDEAHAVTRAPVVTVMGHVDHGKTSLLDYIRKSNVTAGEAGGITQSIGAYTVALGENKEITFIDTPGHAAFTAMRARGAKVTDIVVLVVAADDGIMPQTVEAIDHAKAAGVPIIVAMNKMDKPHVNPDAVKQGLMKYDLVPEEWGGDIIVVPVSAKTGEGVDSLLESIYLQAEMQELKADPTTAARGVVIEAKLDKGKGPVASVLVQNGTLHTGDNLISGTTMGRVRAMIDDKGRTVKEAGPSTAVSVLGLEDVPNAGDSIFAVEQSLMKQVQEERKNRERESMIKETAKVTLDDVFKQVAEGNIKELNVIVKADVQGSVEAVRGSVEKLGNEEVKVKVIHAAAGAISENDIMLADSANAIVIGFNVRPDTKAKQLAERSRVDVRQYRIIYELLDDMEAALKGMLAPKFQEVYMGKAEVKQTFNITGVGTVAGCFVTEGKLVRGGKLRIYRDNVMIVEGNVKTLKHYKDEVKEIAAGLECGCAIDGFNEIHVGDFIECYITEEIKQA